MLLVVGLVLADEDLIVSSSLIDLHLLSLVFFLADLDARMIASFNAAVFDLSEYGFAQGIENLIDIVSTLCRAFQEGNALLFCVSQALFKGNFAPIFTKAILCLLIAFVSNQHKSKRTWAACLCLIEPFCDVIEAFPA